jgi:ABC-type multidrug transport system ATPase subunit
VGRKSIEVEGFTTKYGSFAAVDNISFSVEEGSIFAFLGPNGAGKSTTINVLCTIQEKTGGTLRINGNDVTERKAEVRKDIGIVFQECTLDHKLTVIDHGKLVAHDTPYNLKKLHTSSTTRIRMSDAAPLLRYCADHALPAVREEGGVSIASPDIGAVLELVSVFKTAIDDIEIRKGTLDEVFLALTGKEIRD